MSLQGFYGTYEVQTSAGTELDLNATVVISTQATNGQIPITFTNTDGTTRTAAATYVNTLDALRVERADPAQVMYISRYVDPTPGSTYQAIYAIVIRPPAAGFRRLPVWSAKLTARREGGADAAATDSALSFVGTYRVRTTADTQFGAASSVQINRQSNSILTVQITDALGTEQLNTTLVYESETVSVRGATTGTVNGPNGPELVPAVIAMSLAVEDDTRYLYGSFIVGDPEQAGTFGGEEDDPEP